MDTSQTFETTLQPSSPEQERASRLDRNLLLIAAAPEESTEVLRMTVVRLEDSSLVLFGAVMLGDAEARALEKFGTPAYLIVPSHAHARAAKRLLDRYPSLVVVAPGGVREELAAKLRIDETTLSLDDRSVSFVTLSGTAGAEGALLVESANGVTLVLDDLLQKIDEEAGRWALKVDAPSVRESILPAAPVFRTAEDREALRAQLIAWSQIERLNRIVVSRGTVLTDGAPLALIDVAATLIA